MSSVRTDQVKACEVLGNFAAIVVHDVRDLNLENLTTLLIGETIVSSCTTGANDMDRAERLTARCASIVRKERLCRKSANGPTLTRQLHGEALIRTKSLFHVASQGFDIRKANRQGSPRCAVLVARAGHFTPEETWEYVGITGS